MKIQQITAIARDKYVNLYGLGDDQRVYQWDPVKCVWKPYKITPRDTHVDAWDGR